MNGFSQYIYTQPNGTPSGIWVPNDGPRVYAMWLNVHGDVFSLAKWAEYRGAAAAEAVARARADVAGRGLVATIVQNYYGLVAAQRKLASAQQSLREAQQFLDITQKQESGGEVAHSDVVKAQIQVNQRMRDAQDAELAVLKSRLGLSVLVFPDFRDAFTVVDDLHAMMPLLPLADLKIVGRRPTARTCASPRRRCSRNRSASASRAAASCRPSRSTISTASTPTVRDLRSRRPSPARIGRAGAAERAAVELGRGAEQAETGAAAGAGGEIGSDAGPAAAAGQRQHLSPRSGSRARSGGVAARVARSLHRKPAADTAPLSGRRSLGARGRRRPDHAHSGAQRLRRWTSCGIESRWPRCRR